ncbi:hypothetical protein ACFVMC_01675 [Nocardia sp. NPDC127579]|uniref:DUF7373 family lipoprotein n=1 Tax=Nocardia sp. NPDC127579 TaxID=3345402 RepID=UPI00363B4D10
MNLGGRVRLLALAALLTAVGVGCSSTTVAGNPRPMAAPVDVAALKTGPHTPEPTAYDPDIDTVGDLRTLEARRLLNYVVPSYRIDPEIDVPGTVQLFYDGKSMVSSETFPEKYESAAVANNLLAGAYVSRINDNLRSRKKLIIAVLRFPTEAQSRTAAVQFDQITNADPGRHPLSIDGHPNALTSSANDVTAITFLAHGPYMVVVNGGIPTADPAALTRLIGQTLSLQSARLDQQQTPRLDDLLDIPLDPDGIMRRALPYSMDVSEPFMLRTDFGAYQPSGQLHFERNPAAVQAAFDQGGVDLIARQSGIVYRARDLTSAFRLQSALLKMGKNDEDLGSPPGLPDARCVRLDLRDPIRNYDALCAVVFDRYVAVVTSRMPALARIDQSLFQRAAAQYAILARS